MLKRLRALHTNENILIATDVLLSSESSFMNVFLMAYMINVSRQSSPASFIIYCIMRYAAMGIFAICLLGFYRKHTLAAWRISMVFSVLAIALYVFIQSIVGGLFDGTIILNIDGLGAVYYLVGAY